MKKLLCLIFISCLILAQVSPAKDDSTKIIVSGKGIVKAAADVAYIMIAVERTEKSADQAQKIVAEKMKNIMAGLAKHGISNDKIETTQISLFPQYQYDKGKRSLIGYNARNQIKVTTDDLENIGKVIDTVVSAGATNIQNITFSVKKEAPYKKEALQKAFNDAKEKAEIIASASGLTIKKISTIQEAEARLISPIGRLQAYGAGEAGAGASSPITPGKVEVRGNLTVVYECQ